MSQTQLGDKKGLPLQGSLRGTTCWMKGTEDAHVTQGGYNFYEFSKLA